MTSAQLQYSPQVGDLARFTEEFDQFAGIGVVILPMGRVRWSHIESNNGERRENAEILAAMKQLS